MAAEKFLEVITRQSGGANRITMRWGVVCLSVCPSVRRQLY